MRPRSRFALTVSLLLVAATASASYTNFETAQVHPIALTPSGGRLLALNTPDAMLEVYDVQADGSLRWAGSIPTGLEPVSLRPRSDTEVWVVNHLSDSVSIADLAQMTVTRTLPAGREPFDVAFAQGRAFVSSSLDDAILAFNLADLSQAPARIDVFGRLPRALAVSTDGSKVYTVSFRSGNQTSVVNANVVFQNNSNMDPARLSALGINDFRCASTPPPYPPLPPGITRNPALVDPPDGIPKVALITRFDVGSGKWLDEAGQDWSSCQPYRLPDQDLFVIDATSLAVTPVAHLGTILFDVSVNPTNGKLYVPNTEARNFTRFEHRLGLEGHIIDNRMSIVDPAAAYATTIVDLNKHIDRASDPSSNLGERLASIHQPGMMAWKGDGSAAYLTAIGSRKLFVLDGACTTGDCIFGANRATPVALEVGEGPTGVALLEAKNRAYVLNRFSNSIAVVDTAALAKLADVPMHDASPALVKEGRRLLYDGILSSGHGDAACSSCHISGDLDGLAWDLGNPEGDLAPYATALDNVRFIFPLGGNPVECDPSACASHQGFDPQKGPMATQTFRGMLEPLHWRGDRATFEAFNPAFVGLLGAADLGPINNKPAGLSAADMKKLSDFTLDIVFPPNRNRNLDDSLPDRSVTVPGSGFSGNPTRGLQLFDTAPSDAGQPCKACHAHPFGVPGGKLRGVTPMEPTSPDAAALFDGTADLSPHNDLKVAHLRNLTAKLGPTIGLLPTTPDSKSGFGFIHDGSFPSLLHFLSADVFNLSPAAGGQDLRDIASFLLHFPTGIAPCVGQEVTVPQGPPPTAPPADESRLSTLLSIADLANPGRSGELVATALAGGRMRSWHLLAGQWVPDTATETPITTVALRTAASAPVTFMCVPIGSGIRMGGDRDQDGERNGDDCDPLDMAIVDKPTPVTRLYLTRAAAPELSWDAQGSGSGPAVSYDVIGGLISALRASGPAPPTSACIARDLPVASWLETRTPPAAGDGWYYQIRAHNSCGSGGFEPDLSVLDTIICN